MGPEAQGPRRWLVEIGTATLLLTSRGSRYFAVHFGYDHQSEVPVMVQLL